MIKSMQANVSNLYRYGRSLNTHDLLKIIAVLLMIIDHVGWYLLNDYPPLRLIGRAAAPLFFFLIGYSGKVHITPYLVIYGVILSITGGWLIGPPFHIWINILLSFIVLNYLLHTFPLEKMSLLVRLCGFTGCIVLTPLVYPYLEYGLLGYLIAYAARSLALEESTADYWLGASLGVYALYQAWVFGFIFQTNFIAWLITLFVGLYYVLSHYRVHPITVPQVFLLPGLFISRYSLDIYFYHVVLLQIYIVLTSSRTFY
jgi:hypothetical protein